MPEYPHMCRMDHEEIGWRGDDERCPVCRARDEADASRAEAAALRGVLDAADVLAKAVAESGIPGHGVMSLGMIPRSRIGAALAGYRAALAAKLEEQRNG